MREEVAVENPFLTPFVHGVSAGQTEEDENDFSLMFQEEAFPDSSRPS